MKKYIKNFILMPHAITRSQQRGIKLGTLDLILKFGEEKYTRKSNYYYISQKQIKSLIEKEILTPQKAESIKNIIVVVKDGVVITTMHKRNKFRISEKRVQKK